MAEVQERFGNEIRKGENMITKLKLTLIAYILLILAIPMLLCGCVVMVVEEVRNKLS